MREQPSSIVLIVLLAATALMLAATPAMPKVRGRTSVDEETIVLPARATKAATRIAFELVRPDAASCKPYEGKGKGKAGEEPEERVNVHLKVHADWKDGSGERPQVSVAVIPLNAEGEAAASGTVAAGGSLELTIDELMPTECGKERCHFEYRIELARSGPKVGEIALKLEAKSELTKP